MSLEAIISRILDDAQKQREKIIREAKLEAEAVNQGARQEAKTLFNQILEREKTQAKNQEQKLLVNARLEQKKQLLAAKQEIIDSVFAKLREHLGRQRIKKKLIFSEKTEEVAANVDFYLKDLRLEYETEIAKIIFTG